jgi:hypothetical protein
LLLVTYFTAPAWNIALARSASSNMDRPMTTSLDEFYYGGLPPSALPRDISDLSARVT